MSICEYVCITIAKFRPKTTSSGKVCMQAWTLQNNKSFEELFLDPKALKKKSPQRERRLTPLQK